MRTLAFGLALAAMIAACGATEAPTPVPVTEAPEASPTVAHSVVTERAASADGTASFALPDGWTALTPSDPAFGTWFNDELATSLRNGLVTIVAVDEAGSDPGLPTYALLAPVDEATYAAAPARAFVDRSVAEGNPLVLVSEVDLPAGPARRIRLDGSVAGGDGNTVPTQQDVYLVRSGGALSVLVVRTVDREPEAAETIADAIADSLVLPEPPGTFPDVPTFRCLEIVPLAAAVERSITIEPEGQEHAEPGAAVTYAHCPPSSGTHYPDTLLARTHGPTEPTVPQEWVHNLEHGQVVLLYACDGNCESVVRDLAPIARDAPASPLCERPDVLVVARYDDMPAPFALIAWGRLRYLLRPSADEVAAFIRGHADKGPEPQCAAAASGDPQAP